MLEIFLDSTVLIDHFCRADEHLCSAKLLEKIVGGSQFRAWISDYVFSETLGELKSRWEESKGLKSMLRETISTLELARITHVLEDFKKTPNLNVVSIPINQKLIYDKVRELCIEAKDTPIILSVEELGDRLKKEVKLVTGDMRLLIRAKRAIKTLHPSFHMPRCPSECQAFFTCPNRNKYTIKKSY